MYNNKEAIRVLLYQERSLLNLSEKVPLQLFSPSGHYVHLEKIIVRSSSKTMKQSQRQLNFIKFIKQFKRSKLGIFLPKFCLPIDKHEQNVDIMELIMKDTIEIYDQNKPHFSNYLSTPNKMNLKQKSEKQKTVVTNVLFRNIF